MQTETNVITHDRMKDAELAANFANQLDSGRPFVYHITDASPGKDGENYQQICVAQVREDLNSSSKADAMFLGWTPKITRVWRNALAVRVGILGLSVGQILDNAVVQIEDSTTPEEFKDGRMQEPRKYGANHEQAGQPILINGQPVYRNTVLVVGTTDAQDKIIVQEDVVSMPVQRQFEQDSLLED